MELRKVFFWSRFNGKIEHQEQIHGTTRPIVCTKLFILSQINTYCPNLSSLNSENAHKLGPSTKNS